MAPTYNLPSAQAKPTLPESTFEPIAAMNSIPAVLPLPAERRYAAANGALSPTAAARILVDLPAGIVLARLWNTALGVSESTLPAPARLPW